MILETKNVTVIYKKAFKKKSLIALDDFSVTINEGDIYGILGANGAGKTTAMHVMIGLLKPDKGSVSLNGSIPYPGAELFREIAFLPEEPTYHAYLTIYEALTYYSSLYGSKPNDAGELKQMIEYFDLKGFENLRISRCSKGMKQKVGIIQCLIAKPRILFLDEPTRGLDPITVKKLRDIIINLNKNGCTIIINSHVLSEIESLCNRVAILHKSKVIKEDALDNLLPYDAGKYQVEFSRTETVPEYFTITAQTEHLTRGDVPAEMLPDLITFIKNANSTLYEVTLKRQSLEDYLINLVTQNN